MLFYQKSKYFEIYTYNIIIMQRIIWVMLCRFFSFSCRKKFCEACYVYEGMYYVREGEPG